MRFFQILSHNKGETATNAQRCPHAEAVLTKGARTFRVREVVFAKTQKTVYGKDRKRKIHENAGGAPSDVSPFINGNNTERVQTIITSTCRVYSLDI